MFSSIRSKFILIFSIFIFIPLIIIGISLTHILTDEIENKIITNKKLVLEALSQDVIDKQISNMEATTLTLSKSQNLHRIFDDIDVKGQVLEQWEICINIFLDNIFIHYGTDNNEILTSNSWEVPLEYTTHGRPWYQTGYSSSSVQWTDPYIEFTTKELTLSSTIGIKNNLGQYSGVMSINTTITKFLENLQDKSKGINNEIIMVFDNILPFTINDTIQNNDLSFNWGDIVLNKREFLVINDVYYYYKSIPIPKLNAHLILLIDKHDIDHEVYKYLMIIIPILSAGLILTIIAAFIMSKSIIDKITQARLYLSELSKGNYNYKVNFAHSGEFSILNSSINILADTISSKISELENVNIELNNSLEKTNKLVSLRTSLLHLLSHNSASPITLLYNMTYNLLYNDKNNNEYLMLHSASKNLKSLNENIMTYIKLDEGFDTLKLEILDLQNLTEIIMHNYNFICDEKKIKTSIISDKPYSICNNYFMVKMILENLIDNAIKYSFIDSDVIITISSADKFIFWDIEDGGPGFTTEDKKSIFGKFKTLSSKPTGGEGSVGLGLYIVKHLSESLGVSVNLIDNEKDNRPGAKFRLTFKKNN